MHARFFCVEFVKRRPPQLLEPGRRQLCAQWWQHTRPHCWRQWCGADRHCSTVDHRRSLTDEPVGHCVQGDIGCRASTKGPPRSHCPSIGERTRRALVTVSRVTPRGNVCERLVLESPAITQRVLSERNKPKVVWHGEVGSRHCRD